jgi:ABC-type antimicrobial peptide transport system permease subunit
VFGPASNQAGAAGVVVLSYRLWSRLFDRNPAVLGHVVTPLRSALLSALVFSLAGLYFIRRQDLGQTIRDADARSTGGRSEHRVRAALAITQLAPDPPSMVLAVLVLGVTALLAGWIPARRASRVAPMEALRDR